MLTDNALEILKARYLRRGPDGQVAEDADGLFGRVARAVAAAEGTSQPAWEARFYAAMRALEFLPNSPTLMNAGLPGGQLSACFVLPVPDRLEDIFGALTSTALIHQSGGGTGFNFSSLRPRGDPVGGGQGAASGPVGFIRVFDAATEQIKQGGRRRGANMGILNADHPDILEFIRAKHPDGNLHNFNLSVGVSDRFMTALENGEAWELVNPRNKKAAGRLPAREVWEALCGEAWHGGDPGLLFLDAVNRGNPVPGLGRLEATNPCGELPLLPFESCNLGSVNLARMLKEEAPGKAVFDWPKLRDCVQTGIRFLDDVITVNHYLLPEVEAITRGNRKVGLGVMGWGQALLRLGLPYASEEAVALAGQVMALVREASYAASESLAAERGTFPNWPRSVYAPARPMRNASCNSIAPTGSISILAGTSYSIEPLYALAYRRVGILGGRVQLETDPVAREVLGQLGYWNAQTEAAIRETGSLASLKNLPGSLRELFATAHEIPWPYHLKHQQAFQQHTDNAVAKTINLPGHTAQKEVSGLFLQAWKMGLKGVTVYRDGSRADQVLQHCKGAASCQL